MIRAETSIERNVDAAAAVDQGVKDGLMDAASAGFEVSQRLVPFDRGTLLQSGFQPQERSDGAIVWGYGARHAEPIADGTKPFTPPLEPLLEWGERVLGSRSGGYFTWKKIREEGVDQQDFISPGIAAQKAKLRARGLGHYVTEAIGSHD